MAINAYITIAVLVTTYSVCGRGQRGVPCTHPGNYPDISGYLAVDSVRSHRLRAQVLQDCPFQPH